MLLIVFKYVKLFFTFFLIGFVIKLVDDSIDVTDANRIFDKLLNNMQNGIIPYILVIFSISCLLDYKLTVSIFISSYIIGMFNDINRILSFKLKGYQEAIILFLIGIFFLGKSEMISSFLLVLIIQLLDDIIDLKNDKYYGRNNLCLKFGFLEVSVFLLILTLLLFKLSYIKLLFGMLIFLIFQLYEFIRNRGII